MAVPPAGESSGGVAAGFGLAVAAALHSSLVWLRRNGLFGDGGGTAVGGGGQQETDLVVEQMASAVRAVPQALANWTAGEAGALRAVLALSAVHQDWI